MCARDVQIAIAGVLRARSDDCASIGYATPWADTAVSNEQTLKILYAPAHGPAEIVIALEALPATPHDRFEVTLIV
jgi:hypothetical protein